MASETSTPNVGLQIPAFNQPNWQVPTNFNWNLLDQIFGGLVTIPALSVASFIITNIGAQIAASFVPETPAGVVPGNVYTLTYTPTVLFGFYRNGVFQRPGLDYSLAGAVITMIGSSTADGDNVFAVYLK
jgi:hypothetical protein